MDDQDMPPLLDHRGAPPHAISAAFLPTPSSSSALSFDDDRDPSYPHHHSQHQHPQQHPQHSPYPYTSQPYPAHHESPYTPPQHHHESKQHTAHRTRSAPKRRHSTAGPPSPWIAPPGGTPYAIMGTPSLAPSDSISALASGGPGPGPAGAGAGPVPAYAMYPIPIADSAAAYPNGGGGGGMGGGGGIPAVAAVPATPYPSPPPQTYPMHSPYPPQPQFQPSQYDTGTYEPRTSSSAFRHTALHDAGWPYPAEDPSFSSPPIIPPESLAYSYPASPHRAPAGAVPLPLSLPAPGSNPGPAPGFANGAAPPPPPPLQPMVYTVPYSAQTPRYMRRASSEAPVQHALDTVRAGGLTDVADRRFFDRPGSWRPDFRMPRTGLDVFFPKKPMSISRALSEKGPYELNSKIRYAALREPPVVYDVRSAPTGTSNALHFRDLRRRPTQYDLAAFATEPPVPLMRLYHARLPWYVDVVASDPVGVTLSDVFETLYAFLHARIHRSDFYNSAVSEEERAKIAQAFWARCGGDDVQVRKGIRRVDFLLRECLFLGLSKGKDGMWELRTRKA